MGSKGEARENQTVKDSLESNLMGLYGCSSLYVLD